jgi:Ca2+-transporting ATPase
MAAASRSPDPPAPAPARWHGLDAAEVARALATDCECGLASSEAALRLARHGPNLIPAAPGRSRLAVFAAQFRNVMIVILLAALVPSSLLGHAVESITIAVIVGFAVLLGFFQEWRAERALEALRGMAAPTARVLRDGVLVALPARELVPGDVMLVAAGDRVAADARLVEAANLRVSEAALTGESEPVDRDVRAVADAAAPVGDRRCLVHSGTTVTYGRGRAIVVATGAGTEFGRVAGLLQAVEIAPTPLQRHLARVGRVLAVVALGVVAVVFGLGVLRGEPFLDMFLAGVALAVAVVPEALPAVVTVSLALGVRRMAARNALVRQLAAVETLGSTTVICSDKTGTLTRDQMTVRRIWLGGRLVDVEGVGYETSGGFLRDGQPLAPTPALRELLTAGALCNDARLEPAREGTRIAGDPTEVALVVVAAKAGLARDELEKSLPRVDEIPFSSETRRMATLHCAPAGLLALVKGAPEVVLERCAQWRVEQGVAPFDAEARERALAAAQDLAASGLRVIAAASREHASREQVEQGLTLLGLFAMLDPPRPEAAAAVETCRRAGIKPVMITGDHPLTAGAVGRELGLCDGGRVVRGEELETWSDQRLAREVEDIDVYARVSPEHKLRVVKALQSRGHVVAMTGDGVNDAPALKRADIGIAMGLSGTDVSREAAAMTLLDDDFASIVAAVEEGRGIFSNIRKYLGYLLSSNLGEVALMVVAALAGLPLPLSAAQILYVNLATDGLPALALAADPHGEDLMRRRPRDPARGILARPVLALIAAGGLWSAAVNLAVFAGALLSGRDAAEARTLTFVSLILIQLVKAYHFRSDRHSVLRSPLANRWLDLAVTWELLLLCAVVHVPFLQRALGTHPLGLGEWAFVAGAALTVSPVLEAVKWLVRRGRLGPLD